jgi:hypothetical protein
MTEYIEQRNSGYLRREDAYLDGLCRVQVPAQFLAGASEPAIDVESALELLEAVMSPMCWPLRLRVSFELGATQEN